MGPLQRFEQCRRWRFAAAAPAGHDQGAGLVELFQAAIGQDLDAAHGAHRPGIDRNDAVLVPGEVELRTRQAEDLHGDAEFEGAEAIVDQDRDQTGKGGHLAESYQ